MQEEREHEFVYKNPKTFVMGGDMGDIIYHLLFIKKLGGNKFHLDPSGGHKGPKTNGYIRAGYIQNGNGTPGKFDLNKALFLLPLLKQQPYLQDVDLYSGDPIDAWMHYDAHGGEFHKDDLGIKNLTWFHAKKYNLSLDELQDPWIEVSGVRDISKDRNIVVNRTLRYRGNDNFYHFQRDLINEKAIFVGLLDEYKDFVSKYHTTKVPFVVTNDCLELAQVIKGCDRFIGNGSLAASIAIGLGLQITYEFCPHASHYMFERDNFQVF